MFAGAIFAGGSTLRPDTGSSARDYSDRVVDVIATLESNRKYSSCRCLQRPLDGLSLLGGQFARQISGSIQFRQNKAHSGTQFRSFRAWSFAVESLEAVRGGSLYVRKLTQAVPDLPLSLLSVSLMRGRGKHELL